MKAYISGVEGASLAYIKGSDITFNVGIVDDDGTAISLASPAVTIIELHLTAARTDTPAATISVTPATGAAAGFGTFKVEDTDTTLSRQTYYLWVKWKSDSGTGVGTTVKISNTASTLVVR